MNFISLIPTLDTLQGHQYTYHKHLEQVVQPFQALIARDCALTGLPGTWRPFFRSRDNLTLRSTWYRFIDFCRLFQASWGPRPLFFFESFNLKELLALTCAALLFAKKESRLCLLFRVGLQRLALRGRPHQGLLYLLKKKMGKRLILCTDSERVASSFPTPLSVLPIPHCRKRKAPLQEGPLFIWPGEPRVSKGLLEVQRLLDSKDPCASSCTLKLSRDWAGRQSLLQLMPLAAHLTEEEYERELAACSFVLLPYDPKVYAFSTSGIFVEAVILGLIPLVKAGSWLAHELQRFDLKELIVDWEAPDFFKRALLLQQNPHTRSKLERMQKAYEAFHNPESYLAGFSTSLTCTMVS